MDENKHIDQLEKRVVELERKVAAGTTTLHINPKDINIQELIGEINKHQKIVSRFNSI